MSAVEPHRATITVQWDSSAYTGDPEAIQAMLSRNCEMLLSTLTAWGVVNPSVTLELDPKGPS